MATTPANGGAGATVTGGTGDQPVTGTASVSGAKGFIGWSPEQAPGVNTAAPSAATTVNGRVDMGKTQVQPINPNNS